MDKTFTVYLLASGFRGYLYTGVTSNLPKRLWEHKNGHFQTAHTKKYNIHQLVYTQIFEDAESAFNYEDKLKKMPRHKKYSHIEEHNRDWQDLSSKFVLSIPPPK